MRVVDIHRHVPGLGTSDIAVRVARPGRLSGDEQGSLRALAFTDDLDLGILHVGRHQPERGADKRIRHHGQRDRLVRYDRTDRPLPSGEVAHGRELGVSLEGDDYLTPVARRPFHVAITEDVVRSTEPARSCCDEGVAIARVLFDLLLECVLGLRGEEGHAGPRQACEDRLLVALQLRQVNQYERSGVP